MLVHVFFVVFRKKQSRIFMIKSIYERFSELWVINKCFKCNMVEAKEVYSLLLPILMKVCK